MFLVGGGHNTHGPGLAWIPNLQPGRAWPPTGRAAIFRPVPTSAAHYIFALTWRRYRFSGGLMPKTDKLSITVIGEEQHHSNGKF